MIGKSYWRMRIPRDIYASDLLNQEAKDCYRWNWKISNKKPQSRYIELRDYTLKGDEPKLFKEQGYRMLVEQGKIIIESPTPLAGFMVSKPCASCYVPRLSPGYRK